MNQIMTPSVRTTADTYWMSRSLPGAIGSRPVSSHETANIPGVAGMPP